VQCSDCTTFHFLWCLRIASFGAVTRPKYITNLTESVPLVLNKLEAARINNYYSLPRELKLVYLLINQALFKHS